MDEFEAELRRSLIARRAVLNDAPHHALPDQVEAVRQAENQLYEYQLKVGSPAVYFTYEVNHGIL